MRISEHCFALTGLAAVPPWNMNAGIVAGKRKTLIIDSGASAAVAATIFGYASAVAPRNELVVVNSEQHLDHISGNAFFRERGIDVLGHESIRRKDDDLAAFREEFRESIAHPARRSAGEEAVFFAGTRLENPNVPLTEETILDLGDLMVEVLFTPGHTPSNLALFVREERVVFTGDTIVAGFLPNLECGEEADWKRWITSLEKLRSLDAKVAVPGHGAVLRDEEIDREIERTTTILQHAIASGVAPTVTPA